MIAALAAIGMGVVSSMFSLQQGDQQNKIANMNADVSMQNATQARYAAREEAAQIRLRSSYTVAQQKATVGASGI
jgi:hypothetical protein